MSDNFNPIFINSTLQILEKRCLILLCEGYNAVKSNSEVSIDWNEEDISKELIQCLKSNSKRVEWKIRIEPEHRIYEDDGIAANKSPRIDFCFSTWTEAEWDFFAEAKNLVEVDTPKINKKGKKGNTIIVSAKHLHNRYISTGIDNYVSGRYPSNGCLIGYILQGNLDRVVSIINECLNDSSRANEKLVQQSLGLADFNLCYVSTHSTFPALKHLMFDFTPS